MLVQSDNSLQLYFCSTAQVGDRPPTYADGTTTRASNLHLRMYVLAQFPDTLNFSWVRALRSKLVKDEVKHQDFKAASLAFPGDRRLWTDVEKGLSEATIFVVDANYYARTVAAELLASGAELGVDFTWGDVLFFAAEQLIAETPAYELCNPAASVDLAGISSAAWLLSSGGRQPGLPLPREVLNRLGGQIRHALLYAARSQAVFDTDDTESSDYPAYLPQCYRQLLAESKLHSTLTTPRVFDAGEPKGLDVLKQVAKEMANAYPGSAGSISITERDSRTADGLQAADIAAGRARDLIDSKGVRILGDHFRKVMLNGRNLSELLR
jgi:hypothetical protein